MDAAPGAAGADSGDEAQVTCRFVTTLPPELRITTTPFALPARLTRYGLSEVVNHLLAHGEGRATLPPTGWKTVYCLHTPRRWGRRHPETPPSPSSHAPPSPPHPEPPLPFDFIVEGELVRSSLEKIVLAKRLSTVWLRVREKMDTWEGSTQPPHAPPPFFSSLFSPRKP